MEIKFEKNLIDRITLENSITVKINRDEINVSPIEMKGAYYLPEIFKEKLNKILMNEYRKLVRKWKERNS